MKCKKNNKKGFSLIEVIVATGILSITVFGVYKLIAENTRVVENANLVMQEQNLFDITKNCIRKEPPSESITYLYLGDKFQNCTFSVDEIPNAIDNIDYFIKVSEATENSTDKISFWKIEIENAFRGTVTQNFLQKK